MKATWLLVMVICTAAVTYGQAPEASPRTSLQRAAATGHFDPARNTVGNIERAIPANGAQRQLNRKATLKNSRHSGADGSIQNKVTGHTSSVLLPSTGRSTLLSINNVRHRGPNPAIVGFVKNSHTNNSGVLDGARMSRKP